MRPVAHGVVARRRAHLPRRRRGAVLGERPAPQEPGEVFAEALGRDAAEAGQEPVQLRVEGVHAVDLVRTGDRAAVLHAQLLHGAGIGGRLVGEGEGAPVDLAVERGEHAALRDRAAAGQLQERGTGVVHPAHDADLLARKPALRCRSAPVARGSGKGELALGVVALEALAEVRLIELHGCAGLRTELGQVALDALDEPHAHEPGRAQRHAAALRALAQRQAVDEALEVAHPHGRLELAAGDDGVGLVAKRAPAALAEPALGAVGIVPLADDALRPAMRAEHLVGG